MYWDRFLDIWKFMVNKIAKNSAMAGNTDIRIVGNLLGDPEADVVIGSKVRGVFEHHEDAEPPFTLLQWERL